MQKSKPDKLIVYGRQPVIEALKSGVKIYDLWLAKNLEGKAVRQIVNLAKRKKIAIQSVTKDEIQKLTGPVVHQGAAVRAETGPLLSDKNFDELLSSRKDPVFLILDQIQDPHNLGAVLRTADITSVDAVISAEKGSAELNGVTAKTSAGAMFHVPMYRTEKLQTVLEKLQAASVKIYAMLHTAEDTIYGGNFSGGTAVIIGNEGYGVRKNLLVYCDKTLRIPQMGKVNSLNASVSAGVILYEIVRQRLGDTI